MMLNLTGRHTARVSLHAVRRDDRYPSVSHRFASDGPRNPDPRQVRALCLSRFAVLARFPDNERDNGK